MAKSKSQTRSGAKELPAADVPDYTKGDNVRVWWPPTTDKKKTDYAGCYWPVKVVAALKQGTFYKVQYDNGELETVNAEHVHPANPPVAFGEERVPFEVGEFVEVFNGSQLDPAAWIGRIHRKAAKHYTVSYPFHDAPKESIKLDRLRRARIWDRDAGIWRIVKPEQEWEDGEIESPLELETITSLQLAKMLASADPAVAVKAANTTAAAPAPRTPALAPRASGVKKKKKETPRARKSAAKGTTEGAGKTRTSGSSKRKGRPERART